MIKIITIMIIIIIIFIIIIISTKQSSITGIIMSIDVLMFISYHEIYSLFK